MFILLGGYPPFYDDNEHKLFDKIRRCDWDFDDAVWEEVSKPAKDLIQRLIVKDPTKRLTVEQILRHPWMTLKNVSTDPLNVTRKNLLNYNAKCKMKRAVHAAVAIRRMEALTDEDRPDRDEQ